MFKENSPQNEHKENNSVTLNDFLEAQRDKVFNDNPNYGIAIGKLRIALAEQGNTELTTTHVQNLELVINKYLETKLTPEQGKQEILDNIEFVDSSNALNK